MARRAGAAGAASRREEVGRAAVTGRASTPSGHKSAPQQPAAGSGQRASTTSPRPCGTTAGPAARRGVRRRAGHGYQLDRDHARARAGRRTRASCWSISRSADSAIRATSNEPSASGLAELAAGTASFGDIITRDRLSRAAPDLAGPAADRPRRDLSVAAAMAPSFDALARSYDHVVIDAGAICGARISRPIAQFAPRAVLVADALTDAGDGLGAPALAGRRLCRRHRARRPVADNAAETAAAA